LPNTLNALFFKVPRRALVAIAYILIALLITFALMQFATGGRVAYTMDSLTYRDAALNFISGHPMQATNVMEPVPERQPLTVWPPGYPALWALVASLGSVDIDDVSSLLNPALLGITTLIIFWIGWVVSGRLAAAFTVASVSAFAPPIMGVYGHAWSETVFIPLLLLAYAAFWKYRISQEKFAWLAAAAICIGIANWIRYAGVAFLPILGFSVLVASGALYGKRILHAAGAMFLCIVLVFPLWFRNWQLTGNISGSNRGGAPSYHHWYQDWATIADLFEHTLFGFNYMLLANLKIPLVILAIIAVSGAFRRHGMMLLRPPEIWLPIIWLTGYLLFLIFARMIQTDVPMDLRMLAVAFPFLLLAFTPAVNSAFSCRWFDIRKILIVILFGLLVNSGLSEADRVRNNYALSGEPGWRSEFAIVFQDLRKTSQFSRSLQDSIGPILPSTLILTDFRALYIRYLTGARAYSPYAKRDCTAWTGQTAEGLLLIRSSVLPHWAIDCLQDDTRWRFSHPDMQPH
jgi:4-amino-4-deoxy-L-arabinose transferase-like glycosyltransferase